MFYILCFLVVFSKLHAYVQCPRYKHFNYLYVYTNEYEPGLEVVDKKLPVYPYVDAPINLFWGHKILVEPKDSNIFMYLDQVEKAGNGVLSKYKDGLAWVIDKKRDEKRPKYEYKPPYVKDQPRDTESGVDYYQGFDNMILDGENEYTKDVKVDLAEYDAVCPGLGKWPTREELVKSGFNINTSLFPKFKPVKGLGSKPPVDPYRKEIVTIGEAIADQKKWLQRSKEAIDSWVLDCEEMEGLPERVRDSYYGERFNLIKDKHTEVFELALKMRRALSMDKEISYHPIEFKYIEDSYAYTKPKAPVTNDMYMWHDPLDATWRLRIEELIKDVVSYDWPITDLRVHSGLLLHDITWTPGIIKIFVKRATEKEFVRPDVLGEVNMKELKLLYSKIDAMLNMTDLEEDWDVCDYHKIEVYNSVPDKYPESRRDWNERKGVSVVVKLKGSKEKEIRGKLAGSDSVFGLKIDVNDKIITIPTHFISVIESDASECVFPMDPDVGELDIVDVHQLFDYYNLICFNNELGPVLVNWSKKLTSSAGTCQYKSPGMCIIRLSEPLLKYRPVSDCKKTLLHEMIHAYLFLKTKNHRHSGHGAMFKRLMKKVNEITHLNITITHNFYHEVNYHKKYVWRCNGRCREKPPRYGYVRRARNCAPNPRESWWSRHVYECGGRFMPVTVNTN